MGSYRVLRGGSFNNNDNNCRSANRNNNNPDNTNNNNGFRVVRVLPARKPPSIGVPARASAHAGSAATSFAGPHGYQGRLKACSRARGE